MTITAATPMMMLSGVFFPLEQLPGAVQLAAALLPLHHGVELVREVRIVGERA